MIVNEIEVCLSAPNGSGYSEYVEIVKDGIVVSSYYRRSVLNAVSVATEMWERYGGKGSGVLLTLSRGVCNDLDAIEAKT